MWSFVIIHHYDAGWNHVRLGGPYKKCRNAQFCAEAANNAVEACALFCSFVCWIFFAAVYYWISPFGKLALKSRHAPPIMSHYLAHYFRHHSNMEL